MRMWQAWWRISLSQSQIMHSIATLCNWQGLIDLQIVLLIATRCNCIFNCEEIFLVDFAGR